MASLGHNELIFDTNGLVQDCGNFKAMELPVLH